MVPRQAPPEPTFVSYQNPTRVLWPNSFLDVVISAIGWPIAGSPPAKPSMSSRARRRGPTCCAPQQLTPIVADVVDPATLVGLPTADTVLYAVGYDRTTAHQFAIVYVDGMANVLAALPPETGRIVYISSTGVYGQTSGERVDETSDCRPVAKGARPASQPNGCCRPIRLVPARSFCDWQDCTDPAHPQPAAVDGGPAIGGTGRGLPESDSCRRRGQRRAGGRTAGRRCLGCTWSPMASRSSGARITKNSARPIRCAGPTFRLRSDRQRSALRLGNRQANR